MMIKINWIKQKISGVVILIFLALLANVFEIDEEIAFVLFMLILLGLCLLLSKRRLFNHDYIFIFDVDKFLKG